MLAMVRRVLCDRYSSDGFYFITGCDFLRINKL